MVKHCDKCGTELDPDQARHHEYRVDHPSDSEETFEGRLCSDCFWAFEDWLETK